MTNGWKRSVVVAVSIIGCVVVLAAPSARAGARVSKAGPFRYVVASVPADQASPARLDAICPTGFRATGGGGAISGKGGARITGVDLYDLPNVFPFSDADTEPDDGYEAKAWNPSTARSITAYAVCLSDAGALTYPHFATTTSGSSNAASADCDANVMVGGGGESDSPDDEVDLLASSPGEGLDGAILNDWFFAFHTSDPSYNAAADASCLPPGMRHVHAVKRVVSTGHGGTVRATVMCPGASHVSGGGVYQHGDLTSSRPADGPDSDKAPDDGWTATMSHQIAHTADTVYAVCVK